MTLVGEASVAIRPDMSGFKRQLTSGVNSAVAGATGSVRRSGAALGGVIAAGAASAAVGATAAVAFTAKIGLGFASMKEQAQIAFTTMLGSGKKATAFLGGLQKFAASTPFEFPDLVRSSQRLLAMGFAAKDVVPTLTDIGDAVAGLGGGAAQVEQVTTVLGQIQAKAKASGDEMLQLTSAGIPAYKFLAQAIGKSVPEAMDEVTKGTITAGVAIEAIRKGMQQNFGGMMQAQSQSLAGLWSTLKDNFSIAAGAIVSEFIPQIKTAIASVSAFLQSPEFTAGVKTFISALGAGIGAVIMVAQAAWPTIQSIGAGILTMGQTILAWVQTNWPQIKAAVLPVIESILSAQRSVMSWVEENWPRIGAIIMGVVSTAAGVVRGAMQIIRAVIAAVSPIWTKHGAEVRATGQAIKSIVQSLSQAWREHGTQVTSAVQTIASLAVPVLRAIMAAIRAVAAVLQGDWSAAWTAAKQVATTSLQLIQAPARIIGTQLASILGNGARAAVRALGGALKAAPGAVQSALAAIPGILLGIAGQAASAAFSIGSNIVSGIMSGAGGLLGQLRSYLEGQVRGALSKLNPFSPVSHGGEIYIGMPIVEGAVKGVKGLKAKLSETLIGQLRDSMRAAGDSLTSISSDLTSKMGRIFEARFDASPAVARLRDALAAREDSPEARALQAAQAARARITFDETQKQLLATIKNSKDSNEVAKAQADLTVLLAEQAASAAKTQQDAAVDAAQKEVDTARSAMEQLRATRERQVSDLQASLRDGLISFDDFQKEMQKLLADDQGWADVGGLLGRQFADEFKKATEDILRQAELITKVGAETGTDAGVGSAVTDPRTPITDQLREVRLRLGEDRKDLGEAKRALARARAELEKAKKTEDKKDDAKAQKAIDKAAREVRIEEARVARDKRMIELLEAILKKTATGGAADSVVEDFKRLLNAEVGGVVA